MLLITGKKFKDAILQALDNKTSKLNNILNKILHITLFQLFLLFLFLYDICLDSRQYLKIFKHLVIIILQKLNKKIINKSKYTDQ